MKLFLISPFLIAGVLAAGACCCDGPKSQASTTESVERNYLVKGQETDCHIVKEIRDNPGYLAYWDAKNTDPCGLDHGKN